MHSISRRQFTRLILGGIAASLLSRCTPEETPKPTPLPPSLTPTPPASTPTLPPTSRPLLQNDNVPGFYVRYYRPFEAVDSAHWTLSVEGLAGKPQQLDLSDIQSLPRVSQVSRMKCVECWSAPAKWEGFHIRSLLEQVEPLAEAQWIHFYCADGYFESLTLDELMRERVIFAYRMNDQPLPAPYGAPLRLIVPFKYGYKGPKALTRLVFATEELPGYWPTEGGYSTKGDIGPGADHPLDLGGTRRVVGGEIRYPEGIESKSG
jgi:sulfoxide reductase catalytic subunit YedY